MKFGELLSDKKKTLTGNWAANCLDYHKLKLIIKNNIKNLSVSTFSPNESYAASLSKNLSDLSQSTTQFFDLLEKNIHSLNSFYKQQVAILIEKFNVIHPEDRLLIDGLQKPDETILISEKNSSGDTLENCQLLLKELVNLERFILLNYTGISKIMKKLDRHSGLNLSSPFILSVSKNYEFYTSEHLGLLKKKIMDRFTDTTLTNHYTTEESPLYVEYLINNHGRKLHDVKRRKHLVGSSDGLSKLQGTVENPSAFPPLLPSSANFLLPNQKVLVTMSGPHGTDIIGAVIQCLSKHKLPIQDFVSSRLQHNVTFGCVTTLNPDSSPSFFADLNAKAIEWESQLSFDIIKHEQEQVVEPEHLLEDAPYKDREKYTATVLNQSGLTSKFLYDWMRLLLDYKISVEKMERLSSVGTLISCDFKLSIPTSVMSEEGLEFRERLFSLSVESGTDVAIQKADVFRKSKRLVVFDMDSTLIQQEVIDEIAKHAGVVGDVAKITELAMNGEIDFTESLRQRVALLKGTSTSVLEKVRESLIFTEGAFFLCKALKRLGYKLAVISGGFMPLAIHVKNQLGLDYAFANQLRVSPDGKTLTGETYGPIVDGQRKAELLQVIAQAESISLEQVVAVGDGANDLWMLSAAGLGIAFNAKPRVQEKARARINQKSLGNILYLLGYTDEDARQLGKEM